MGNERENKNIHCNVPREDLVGPETNGIPSRASGAEDGGFVGAQDEGVTGRKCQVLALGSGAVDVVPGLWPSEMDQDRTPRGKRWITDTRPCVGSPMAWNWKLS